MDADLYVARPELEERLRSAIEHQRNALVIGPTGSGKTTLARAVAARVPAPVAWVNGSLAEDGFDLLKLAGSALREAGVGAREAPRKPLTRLHETTTGAMRMLVALNDLPRDPPAVVIVDGATDDEAVYDVFGRMRDQLWSLSHTWVLLTTTARSGAARAAPADAFWSAVVEVDEMGPEELKELLDRGLAEEERQLVAAHPRQLLRDTPRNAVAFVHAVLEGTAEATERTQEQQELQVAAAGRSESMALAELQALGRPATAGDPELLARLGWSRPYAARVLARLETAGLVKALRGPTSGQGRPPKLYEPDPRW
jgi:hypothetical protein